MSRRLFHILGLFRKLNANFQLSRLARGSLSGLSSRTISRCAKFLIANQICAVTEEQLNIEERLQKACEEGESAIIELMNQLKECVLAASQQYRTCLQKQIEITTMATSLGPLSDKWDELPPVRSLSDELNEELASYLTLFNTIGQMAYDQSMVSFLSGYNLNMDNVIARYKELEILILYEFELNKKKEIEYLHTKRDSILNEFSNLKM